MGLSLAGVFSIMQRTIQVYVAGITVIACIATGAVLMQGGLDYTRPELVAALSFATFGFLASLLSYMPAQDRSGSIAFLPFLASVVLVPNWLSVAGAVIAHLLTELVSGRAPIKALFNTMQGAIACATAILVYSLLGGHSLLLSNDLVIAPYIGAILIFFAANSLAISGIAAIQQNDSVWRVWTKILRATLIYDVFSIPFVFVFAYVYVHFSVIGAAIFMIPVVAARQLYKKTGQLEKQNQELLEVMVKAIEARDPYTSGHSRRVAEMAKVIGRALGLPERQIERIAVAALLHDVGKIYEIFGPILSKPGKLTAEEFAIMRTHPIKSEELATNVSALKDVLPLIRHHHENWDGSGYPDGLFGAAIPLGSRIIMFADTVDAMTTDRPYRAALDERTVRKELEKFRGKQFDPKIYDALVPNELFSRLIKVAAESATKTPRTPARAVLSLERRA
jgi:HD-GYP domain-containing protein (c-di-GMP phosphodiesterase class II)